MSVLNRQRALKITSDKTSISWRHASQVSTVQQNVGLNERKPEVLVLQSLPWLNKNHLFTRVVWPDSQPAHGRSIREASTRWVTCSHICARHEATRSDHFPHPEKLQSEKKFPDAFFAICSAPLTAMLTFPHTLEYVTTRKSTIKKLHIKRVGLKQVGLHKIYHGAEFLRRSQSLGCINTFPAFHGIWSFVIELTKAHHWTQSWHKIILNARNADD